MHIEEKVKVLVFLTARIYPLSVIYVEKNKRYGRENLSTLPSKSCFLNDTVKLFDVAYAVQFELLRLSCRYALT